jgi:hypothetical protein
MKLCTQNFCFYFYSRKERKCDTGSICAAFEGREQFDFDGDPVISLKDRKELFKGSLLGWPEHL